jgi:hypothetical protein
VGNSEQAPRCFESPRVTFTTPAARVSDDPLGSPRCERLRGCAGRSKLRSRARDQPWRSTRHCRSCRARPPTRPELSTRQKRREPGHRQWPGSAPIEQRLPIGRRRLGSTGYFVFASLQQELTVLRKRSNDPLLPRGAVRYPPETIARAMAGESASWYGRFGCFLLVRRLEVVLRFRYTVDISRPLL